jgi:hypothetical protein
MIFVISFASAHDLFINHFEPNKTAISQTSVTIHSDNKASTHNLHHSLHTDAIFSSEYIYDIIIAQVQILSSSYSISYNLKLKQIKPPIA